MQFRKDINGLRAVAVSAVVLFHFNPNWMPGGFAGVDVFFVISGFLMTGIISTGLSNERFSLLKFYVARANRIIPALAVLCITLTLFGWLFLSPLDFKSLGKHVSSSITFISNIVYWREAGYFDDASHEKWLLHTWSLSVEWQFYILYPLILVVMGKFMSMKTVKIAIVIATILGFIFCIVATYIWPNPSYYLLPTRAWQMMIGGVAFIYPLNVGKRKKYLLEYTGLLLIVSSYIFIDEQDPWPGYHAIFPVLGTYLVIQAHRNRGFITGNFIFQSLGRWSYSIYLWHWPIVVFIHHYSLGENSIYLGLCLSVAFGYLSAKHVEVLKFRSDIYRVKELLHCKPLIFGFLTTIFGLIVYFSDGFLPFAQKNYQELVAETLFSPYRDECHISAYKEPKRSCEYHGSNLSWAVLGDSHSVEIAYSLAQVLKDYEQGLKHFTFSGCRPSYEQSDDFSNCAKWYNESVMYIIADEGIRNVVLNHRFTEGIFGGNSSSYPSPSETRLTDEALSIIKRLDDLIYLLAAKKENVYIFQPIPELPKHINKLIGREYLEGNDLTNIPGTDLIWYRERNQHILKHFDSSNYPSNVHLINSESVFCDSVQCYAVRDEKPLYFDDDHPSIHGANLLVEKVWLINERLQQSNE